MKFDAVEARGLRAHRGGCEQRRQRLRQVANVWQFDVRDALPITLHEGFVLTGGKRLSPAGLPEFKQACAHRCLAVLSDRAPVSVGHPQEALEKLRGLGAAPDRQKIDDLDEQPRPAAARTSYGVNEPFQPADIAVVTDAQQRAARDVSDASRLDDDCSRSTARQPLIPSDDGIGDKAVFRRAPGHHRRNPGALRDA